MPAPEMPRGLERGEATVEVVYARPGLQRVVRVPYAAGLTAGQAVEAAGLMQEVPELAASEPALGVFGQVVPPGHPLRPDDRVEIYRPLRIDPREARRRRVAEGRAAAQSRPGRGRN